MKYEKGTFATVPIKLIDGLDPHTQVVFMHICKFVNEGGHCWPSLKKLAQSCGMSRRTVIRRIEYLQQMGIIRKTARYRENGSYTSNNYELHIEHPEENIKGEDSSRQCHGVTRIVSRSHQDSVTESLSELKKTELNSKELKNFEQPLPEALDKRDASENHHEDITKVMEAFQMTVNPAIVYGHKTNRKACIELIKKFGVDRVVKTVKYLGEIQEDPFAPRITTPHQLLHKFGDLMIYYKREQAKSQTNQIVSI